MFPKLLPAFYPRHVVAVEQHAAGTACWVSNIFILVKSFNEVRREKKRRGARTTFFQIVLC